jgi:YidC/Oxa1 family membrane protein insertase
MTELWTSFVRLLTIIFMSLIQLYGGSVGLAIITLSSCVRIALLPLSLRLARRANAQQEILRQLQPEIDRLKERYKSKPDRLTQETFKLYRQHGYSPLNAGSFIGILVQLPVFAGLYSVIKNGISLGSRFLWIADLAKPDLLLTLIIGLLTFITSLVSPGLSHQSKNLTLILPTLITLLFVWQISSGLGLYWAASSFFGIVQNIVLRKQSRNQVMAA